MSEVEKMYKNAGVKAKWKDKRVKNTKTYYTEEQAKYLRQTTKNRNIQLLYPPFTANEQIELIKWLIQKNSYDERIIRSNFEKTYFYCSYIDDYCESAYFDKLEEALANVFNYFWQDLTKQERTEIKEILRG